MVLINGHPNVKVAGGSVAHLTGLTSEIIDILNKMGLEYEVIVLFAGRLMVEGVRENIERLGKNVKVLEANIYRSSKGARSYLYALFPLLNLNVSGFKRMKEALREANLIISRAPHINTTAITYWTALYLSKPKDAVLVEEHFGNPYWSAVELDVTPVSRKVVGMGLTLLSVLFSITAACTLADKVFVISEGGKNVLLKEALPFVRRLCAKKVVPLYPPIHKAENLPKKETSDKVTFCTSGSFYPHQGYRYLVKLIYVINELFGGEKRVKFKLMGAPIQAAKIVKPLIEGYTNVEFGYIKDRKLLYETYAKECDAFLALYDPFKVFDFYGAPAKLADFVLFKRPIIMWDELEYVRTIEMLTERCDCVRKVKSFEELLREVLKVMEDPTEECECKVKERSHSYEVLEELIDAALSKMRKVS